MSGLRILSRIRNIPNRFSPRFRGIYPDRASALASLPAQRRQGYDDTRVAPVAFDLMCRVAPFDYPVLFWLQSLAKPGMSILDAGGHLGTKYLAFRDYVPVADMTWTVFDLPQIIDVARAWQGQGKLPQEIRFESDAGTVPRCDLMIASGLLQYLDRPFAAFVDDLPEKPRHILLNKVAMRDGPTIVTLEKIGPNRVPYQIRNQPEFEAGIRAAGYKIRDRWPIPSLAHKIRWHPRAGSSASFGYLLETSDYPDKSRP